jgi:hypothetical protein
VDRRHPASRSFDDTNADVIRGGEFEIEIPPAELAKADPFHELVCIPLEDHPCHAARSLAAL